MKVLKKTTLIVTILVLIYWVGNFILRLTPASYRLWVNIISGMLTWAVAPVLYTLLIGGKIFSLIKGKKVLKIFTSIIALLIYLYWCYFLFLIAIFSIQEETRLTRHYLVVQKGGFLSEATYVYYHPVAFFFKVPAKADERLRIEYLEEKYDDLRNLVREYHDGILLFDVSLREVWDKANQDVEGLTAYFKAHKKQYTWDAPRYKGWVIYAKNDVAAKAAKQIVKTAHPDSVVSYLNQRVNLDSVQYVKVERGLWDEGRNAAVDKYGFKNKSAEYVASEEFPIVVTVGKVIKAPQEYEDERGKVVTDYQDYLEKQWIERLREKYPVVVNEEVWEKVKSEK